MNHTWAALAAAATLAATAAPAVSAQDYAPDRIVTSVSQGELVAIVGSLGHQVMQQGDAGKPVVLAQTEEGFSYLLIGTACDVNNVPGCQGLMMQVRFELPPGTTLETLAQANRDQPALTSWADFTEKTLGFARYQVLDHGVSMANIRENIRVMLALLPEAFPIAAGEQ